MKHRYYMHYERKQAQRLGAYRVQSYAYPVTASCRGTVRGKLDITAAISTDHI